MVKRYLLITFMLDRSVQIAVLFTEIAEYVPLCTCTLAFAYLYIFTNIISLFFYYRMEYACVMMVMKEKTAVSLKTKKM